jgi:hypothetical protein
LQKAFTMPFYSVPMTILSTVNIFAATPALARSEARRYVEGLETGEHFKDGWNSIQAANNLPIIDAVDGWAVENIELDEVEALEARWVVVPQCDLNADLAPESEGTRFEACEEASATAWAVFETRDGESDLVEDYPSREQADAAVSALEGGHSLPDPVWPTSPDTDAAMIADGLQLLDCIEDAYAENGRCMIHTADGRVLRVSIEVVGGAE